MVKCRTCGKEIETKSHTINIGADDQVYHLSCAPDDLVRDALEEWNAIASKGIKYFLSKYLPSGIRPSSFSTEQPGESSTSYSKLFTEMGDALGRETGRRKREST